MPAMRRPMMRRHSGKRPPARAGAAATSWEPVAGWYRDHLREEGSLLREVVYPGALRMLGLARGAKLLDIACGEGSFVQLAVKEGAVAVGIDASPGLIRAAEKKHVPRATFAVADARKFVDALRALPRGGAPPRAPRGATPIGMPAVKPKPVPPRPAAGPVAFNGASCLLAVQNIDTLEAVFRDAARVLVPNAPFVIVMSHPAFRIPRQSGWGWDEERKLQYRRIDRYATAFDVPIQAHPGGAAHVVTRTFHRPLAAYVAALAAAGFVVDAMEEWSSTRVSDSGPKANAENLARTEIPMFLAIRARRIV